MEQLKALWANLENALAELSARERRMVLAAGAAVLVFVLFITLFSISSTGSQTVRHTADKMAKLQDVQALAASFREQEAQRQAIERQLTGNGIKLISYVNEKGTAAGLDIQSMNPKADVPIGSGNIIESAVELTLPDVNLRRLVDFLNTVEAGGMVKVKSLRLEPRVANETLTAWITVVTYRIKTP